MQRSAWTGKLPAQRLGPNGQALIHNARAAFMSGQRIALLIGAGALAVGVVFLLVGGAPASVDVLDVAEADSEDSGLELDAVAG
jgi:hypothetical protein